MKTPLVIFLVALLPVYAGARDFPTFRVTDLGTLGGTNSRAYAVNDQNKVVGWSEDTNGARRAFLWTNGVMTDLGTLGGASSEALDISNTDFIAGTAKTPNGSTRAFLLVDGVMSNLGTLGGNHSQSLGVNDRGDVAGDSTPSGGAVLHPVVWRDGAIIDLAGSGTPRLGNALDVNNRGVVVGIARVYAPQERWRPFTWEDLNGDGTNDPGEMVSRNPLGGKDGIATSINELDHFAGSSDILPFSGVPDRGFLVTDDSAWNLGTLDDFDFAEVEDLNDGDACVGYAASAPGAADSEAFLCVLGTITNLNDLVPGNPEWLLQHASGINRRGSISGWGTVSGATHAFLLTPTTNLVDFTFSTKVTNGVSTLAWSGFGSNVLYTLERRDELTIGPWSSVSTTGSWPTLSMFHEVTVSDQLTNPAYRVVGVELP